MSVTIREMPSDFNFAGNPVRFKLQSDNYILNQGINASITLDVASVDLVVGHKMSFTFMDRTVEFTTVTEVDYSGTSILVGLDYYTNEVWAGLIMHGLQQNYYLFTNYDFVQDGAKIILTAKNKGSLYDISFDEETIVGITDTEITAGVDKTLRTGFGIILMVVDKDGIVIGEDIKPVDTDGYANFDIKEYLRSKVEIVDSPRFKFPQSEGEGRYTDAIFNFNVRLTEQYDNIIHGLYWLNQYGYNAVPGGLSFEALSHQNSTNEPWWTNAVNKLRYLSWHPGEKLTRKANQESVYYLIQNSGAYSDTLQLTKCLKFYYDSGLTDEYEIEMEEISTSVVCELQAGYDHLGIDALTSPSKVVKYEIWLKTTWISNEHDPPIEPAETVTEYQKFTFVLDNKFQEFERNFKFKNSFGFYDNLRTTGKGEPVDDYERVSVVSVTDQKENIMSPPSKNVSSERKETFKVNTGWIKSIADQEYLTEFMLTNELWEIVGNRVLPCIITSKKITKPKEGDYARSLVFEYERAYSDQFYSKI